MNDVIGLGKGKKNYKDVDYPKLLHFPLDDESPILSHVELMETCESIYEEPLYVWGIGDVYDKELIKVTNTSSVSLHDPMKRIKLLCTACSRPITKFPFYQLPRDDRCYAIFHDWCFRLPKEVRNHAGHPHDHHTLMRCNHTLYIGRICNFCGLPFNGFAYICCVANCGYTIDVNCAFIPEEITHEAHVNHLLTRVDHASSSRRMECRVGINEGKTYFRCNACDFCLDCRCALHLPKTIRNKCDKHPLQLSYSPIEDYKSEYFCEEGLDPGKWFYHCVECAQSIHSACAPLILQSEQGVNSLHLEGVYKFINIKFGFEQNNHHHDKGHRVTFAPGTENDGLCKKCGSKLQSNLIWKCLSGCDFGVHHACYIYPAAIIFFQIRSKLDYGGTTKRMRTHRPIRNMEFYPTQITMMRPVTRHYEVIDDHLAEEA